MSSGVGQGADVTAEGAADDAIEQETMTKEGLHKNMTESLKESQHLMVLQLLCYYCSPDHLNRNS